MNRNLIAPLTGVAFIVVAIIAIVLGGEPPSGDEPVQKIVDHYTDNKDEIQISAMVGVVAIVLLMFFAAHLRQVLTAADPRSMLPGLVLAGASVMAVGLAIDSTISFTLADRVDDVEPAAVQALQALWDNDFIPILLGITVFLLSAGILIVRTGALPKWLGWIAILLAIVGPTPIGFAAFLGGALWILVVSVLLTMRARAVAPGPPAPTTPAPSPPV